MIEMTEDEKSIVDFVEGKKDCISVLYKELKVYGPEDEPSPGDLKITLRIPVKNGEFNDWFELALLPLPTEGSSVDACAEVTGTRVLEVDGRAMPTHEGSVFLNFGQKKSEAFENWLNEVFWEWYGDWEENFLKRKRERYEREREEKLKWLPDENSRALLRELVKRLAK